MLQFQFDFEEFINFPEKEDPFVNETSNLNSLFLRFLYPKMNLNLKGVFYIAVGASSYGILATFVKYANNLGIGTGGLVFAQYLFGVVVLYLIAALTKKSESRSKTQTEKHPKFKLIGFGTFLGLTSSFYYLSIQYVPVSVGIILLMQTIWMGVLVEYVTNRNLVSTSKIIGAGVTLIGTALAAKIIESDITFDWRGIGFGLLAAASYTGVMFATSKVALELPLFQRSKYLTMGGFLIIVLFWNVRILDGFDAITLLKWGCFLGFFGTLLPPILFSKGMPIVGTGLGSIISALEIPVSVLSAYLVLEEHITVLQWVGISLILFSVFLINMNNLK